MWQYVIGSICTYLSSTLNATTFSFFIHSPVWPDVRIKSSPNYPNNDRKGDTAVLLKSNVFQSSLENCQVFGPLLLEKTCSQDLWKIAQSVHTDSRKLSFKLWHNRPLFLPFFSLSIFLSPVNFPFYALQIDRPGPICHHSCPLKTAKTCESFWAGGRASTLSTHTQKPCAFHASKMAK